MPVGVHERHSNASQYTEEAYVCHKSKRGLKNWRGCAVLSLLIFETNAYIEIRPIIR